MVIVKRVAKSQAPNVTTKVFWLKNRQPERWRERVGDKNKNESNKLGS